MADRKPNFDNLDSNDKAILEERIKNISIASAGEVEYYNTKPIGPDAESVTIYRDADDKIITELVPEDESKDIPVVKSIESVANTLEKLERKDTDIEGLIYNINKELANSVETKDNLQAEYDHNVGDYIVYGNKVFAEVIKAIKAKDTIVNTGNNANVRDLTIGEVLNQLKARVTPIANGGTGTTDGTINGVRLGKSGNTMGYYDINGYFKSFRQPTGDATTADVLSGKTFANAESDSLRGTMTDNGAWTGTGTPTGNNEVTVKIPAGYHNGSGKITCKGQSSYAQGMADADGRSNPRSANYQAGYAQGVADADSRPNPSSNNYKLGYAAAAAKALDAWKIYQGDYIRAWAENIRSKSIARQEKTWTSQNNIDVCRWAEYCAASSTNIERALYDI